MSAELVLEVVHGEPTPEELAALVVVLAASGASTPESPDRPGAWAAPTRNLRTPGYGRDRADWRRSGLPR